MALKFSIEEALQNAVFGAGVGFAVGGGAGAVAGGVSGFVGYLAGFLSGTLVKDITEDERTAEAVRRAVELLVPMNFGAKMKTGRSLFSMVASKAPELLRDGMKYASFGLATGYVVEPYLVEDGDTSAGRMMGIAGLSAVGLYYGKRLAPLGIWAAYSARQIASILSEGKYGAGVLVEDGWRPKFLEKLLGREVELPKIKFEEGKLVVKAYDAFTEGLFKTRAEIAGLAQDLNMVADTLRKHGITPRSELSQRLGELVFDPVDQATLAERLRAFLREQGFDDVAIEEIHNALKLLQKVSMQLADELVQYGQASEKYLRMLGSDKRIFQHVFGLPTSEEMQAAAVRRRLVGETQSKKPLPSVATLYERGFVLDKTPDEFISILGRQPKEGDVVTDKAGRVWAYVRIKPTDSKPRWFRDWTLEELLDIQPNRRIMFVDLAASVYRQISEDLRLVRRLKFYDFLHRVGAARGLVSDRPVAGWQQLLPTGGKTVQDWGTLTGKWVSPELYRHIRAFVEMETYTPPSRTLASVNRIWKLNFLGFNLKSYVNSILGNTVLTIVNGHDPAEVLWHYFSAIGKQDALYKEAAKHGILRQAFMLEAEVMKEARELEKLLRPQRGRPKFLEPIEKMTEFVTKMGEFAVEKWYARTDEMFRYGLYRKLRSDGLSEAQAARIALQAYAYYGDMPILVRQLRDTIMPFISFQVRIMPQLARAFMEYPERFALAFAFAESLQRQAFKEMYGDNWRDGQRFEELVRAGYLTSHIGGFMADFVRVPSLDLDGDRLPSGYMYIGFLPWNIPLSLPMVQSTALHPTASPWSIVILQNPVLRFISGLIFHVDPQTGRAVTSIAGHDRPLASAFQYALATLMPSRSLLRYPLELFAREGWFDPIIQWFNVYGTYPDGSPVGTAHMIWNALMPSVIKFDPEFNLEMSLKRLEALERAYKSQFNRAARRTANIAVLEDNWERLQQNYAEVWQEKWKRIELWLKTRAGRLQ